MSTRPDESAEDRTILPSAHTPEPEYEPGDLIAKPQAIPPRPGGSRANPHGIRRGPASFSTPSAETMPAAAHPPPIGQPAHPPLQQGWRPPSAHSGPQIGQHRPYAPIQRPPMSTVGIYGGGITLLAVILAVVTPFAPFLNAGASISLWGAATGSANSCVILAAAAVGLLAGILMMTSMVRPKCGTAGGILSMVAGAVMGGMAAYLLTNADHRALIAQGGSFGAAAWLLIAATGGLLIGGILGIVRGSTTGKGSP